MHGEVERGLGHDDLLSRTPGSAQRAERRSVSQRDAIQVGSALSADGMRPGTRAESYAPVDWCQGYPLSVGAERKSGAGWFGSGTLWHQGAGQLGWQTAGW
jgi:hypothetical protein